MTQYRTLAGRFVSSRLGSAVQHLAFACNDIFATAAAMQARGFSPLAMHDNYYADIEARFGLPAASLAQMQAHSILYDEDAFGRFYQFYSQPYGDGFFFEVVDRQDGYTGYGAANAPYRTAALKRALAAKS